MADGHESESTDHADYVGTIGGADGEDPNAPEHVSKTFVLLEHDTGDEHSSLSIEYRIAQIHGQDVEFIVGVDGDGLYGTGPVNLALLFASQLELAALRLRRGIRELAPALEES